MSFASDRSRWSDVYVTAGARGISACGDYLAATTLALTMQQAGAGGTAVSALLLAASLPPAVLGPVAGRIADRADSRTVLVVAGLVQAAICVALAFATHVALIVVLVALLACGLAVTTPTIMALLPEMVRAGDLPRAAGINQTAGTVGVLAAPALAGVLIGHFDARVPLLLDAASYLAVVVAGLLIRTRRTGRIRRSGQTAAWRMRDDRLITAVVAAVAAVVLGVGAVNIVEVFFLRETLDASTTVFGLVAASWMAGMVLGSLIVPRASRTHPVRSIMLCLTGVCLAVMAAAGAPSALAVVPFWIFGGICNAGLNVSLTVLMAERVPAWARGRAFAAQSAAVQGAGMIGFLVGGPLVDHVAPRPLVFAFGAAGLTAVLITLPVVRRAMRPGPPRPAVEGRPAPTGDSVGA